MTLPVIDSSLFVAPEPTVGRHRETVEAPGRVVRIAEMTRHLLHEAREFTGDESARRRLQQVYEASVDQVKEVLSEDLRNELSAVAPSLGRPPTNGELRIAQAQLVGWLDGLFQGMQAATLSQLMQAQAQLQEIQRRALGEGSAGGRPHDQNNREPERAGMYL